MNMIPELTTVVLLEDIPSHRLRSGDVGTVVLAHPEGGYEVEFMTLTGDTVAVVTLASSQLRQIGPGEIASARSLERAS